MAKIARATQKLFGTNATAGQIAQYGSGANSGFTGGTTYSGAAATPALVQTLAAFTDGWFAAVDGQYNPAIEDVNALDWLYAYQLCYVFQAGVPEWDSGTTYFKGSIAQDGSGVLYTSIQDTNLNHALSNATWWRSAGGSVQNKSANYQMLSTDKMVVINGGFAATLPDATTVLGQSFEIVSGDGNASNTVKTLSSQTISGQNATSSPYALAQQYQFIKVRSDGSNYWIVSAG